MNTDNYTSLELSKKLAEAGCGLRSSLYWHTNSWGHPPIINDREDEPCITDVENFPAYDILNDICVKYAKEFFGEHKSEKKKCNCGRDEIKTIRRGYRWDAEIIIKLLQQNEKQEAEDYIWERCLFNPKNK